MSVALYLTLIISVHTAQSACVYSSFDSTEVKLCTNVGECAHKEINGCAMPSSIPQSTAEIQVISSLSDIKRGAFQDLVNIKKIILSGIELETITPNCFIGLSTFIFHAKRNKLKIIPYGVFTNTLIKEINLERNDISEIENEAFGHMPELHTLVLYRNKLKTIKRYWFYKTKGLKYLFLRYNTIETVEPGVFDDIEGILSLDLSFNHIYKLEPNVFSKVSFSILDLRRNFIPALTPSHFGNEVLVEKLFIGMNNITHLTNTFRELAKRMSYVQLYPNPISCPCMVDIEAWGRRTKTKIINPAKDRTLVWNALKKDIPYCVVPYDTNKCDYNFAIKNSDGILQYFNVVDYDDITMERW